MAWLSIIKQSYAAFSATLGVFGLGNVLAWTSPALPNMESLKEFGGISDDVQSWIGSIAVLGALFSCPFAGYLADKLGRKKTMMIFTFPFFAGWIIVGFSTTIWLLLIGRFVIGFCAGVFSLSAPIYIAETSENSIRGTMSSLFQIMMVFGILFTYIVGSFVTWYILALISAAVPALAFVSLLFVPESPRFLMIKNRKDDALNALKWLRNIKPCEELPTSEQMEIQELEKSLEDNSSQAQLTMKDLFSTQIMKPVLIVLSLMIFEQFSGYNGVIFYIGSIFKASGSSMDSNLCSIIVGIVQILATFMSMAFVDKAGRRILLLLGQVFMAIPLIVLGIYFNLKNLYKNDKVIMDYFEKFGWVTVLCLVIFISAFSLGIGPLSWTMLAELLAPNIKGVCSAIAVCLVWLSAFIVTKTFANISNSLGIDWCFWIYGICCIVGFISIYFTVPETKGKSLDEIQKLFVKE